MSEIRVNEQCTDIKSMNNGSVLHRINGNVLPFSAEVVNPLPLIHDSVKELFDLARLDVNRVDGSCAVV